MRIDKKELIEIILYVIIKKFQSLNPINMPLAEGPNNCPDDFWNRVELLQKRKISDRETYDEAITDISYIAKGDDSSGIGASRYPGWTAEDFKKLLIELDEEV